MYNLISSGIKVFLTYLIFRTYYQLIFCAHWRWK